MKVFILILSLFFISCEREYEVIVNTDEIGYFGVDLDARKEVIRIQESLLGNLLADALKLYFEDKSKPVDFAVINSGGIRFDDKTRPTGIYLSSVPITISIVEEILPFENYMVSVTATGKQIKEIFEHSVSSLIEPEGKFLQISKGIQIEVDTTRQAEVLNSDKTMIETQGERIISIKINEELIDNEKVYKLATTDFIAGGGDGYVTFANIPNEVKESIGETIKYSLLSYIEKQNNELIIPVLEDRIIIK